MSLSKPNVDEIPELPEYILLPLDAVPETLPLPEEPVVVVVPVVVGDGVLFGGLNVLREPKVLPLWFLLPAVPLPLLLLLLLLLLPLGPFLLPAVPPKVLREPKVLPLWFLEPDLLLPEELELELDELPLEPDDEDDEELPLEPVDPAVPAFLLDLREPKLRPRDPRTASA